MLFWITRAMRCYAEWEKCWKTRKALWWYDIVFDVIWMHWMNLVRLWKLHNIFFLMMLMIIVSIPPCQRMVCFSRRRSFWCARLCLLFPQLSRWIGDPGLQLQFERREWVCFASISSSTPHTFIICQMLFNSLWKHFSFSPFMSVLFRKIIHSNCF